MPQLHEKPLQREACVPQLRVAPAHHNLRKAHVQQRRPSATKNKLYFSKKIKVGLLSYISFKWTE